ncbi:MAG: glycosyltransferase family 4 protein [Abditibacteriales bacterium]|nr:glycosyltransferase family 4 protein [Abditibacteriales bacterium]MDW8364226.1 glycosyltransferase family 4 protein [Abditibacteriales bacterium]
MRIRVTQILEATTGGTRRHLVDLVGGLDKTRFDVRVICSNLRSPHFVTDIERMRQNGVAVDIVPMTRHLSPVRDLRALVHIVRALKRHPCDLVHCHSAKAGFLGRVAARLVGVPAVYTPHCFPFLMEVHPIQRFLYFTLEQFAAGFTYHFIAVSESERDVALRTGLCPAGQITVIHNGVDRPQTADHRPQTIDHRPCIGTVGRLTKQKGQADLLRAARRVVDEFPQAKFMLVGSGEDEPCLRQLTARLGLTENVVFLGEREDAREVYTLFDVYVLPSLWESFPYTPLEAMAAGKPVVATDVGGVREIVADGATGYLVPPHQPTMLAEKICALLRDSDVRQAMGARGRERVERLFTRGRMVRETERIYETVGKVTSDQ